MVTFTFNGIKEVRKAFHMSSKQLAKKLGKAPSTLSELEAREKSGNVTIQSLQEIAKSLECEFHYEFKPKASFTEQLLSQAIKEVKNELDGDHHQYTDDDLKDDATKLIAQSKYLKW